MFILIFVHGMWRRATEAPIAAYAPTVQRHWVRALFYVRLYALIPISSLEGAPRRRH